MFFIALNILIPIKISTGPVAADGITRASGARNREIPKKILVKMTVSPVLPPVNNQCTEYADSKNKIFPFTKIFKQIKFIHICRPPFV